MRDATTKSFWTSSQPCVVLVTFHPDFPSLVASGKTSTRANASSSPLQGHVNNVNYFRYAESARVNWVTNFAVHVDPENREQWLELMTPKSTGLIMRSIKADFKFVRAPPH
jgi:hypothetical protein